MSSPTAAISRTSCRRSASIWYYFRETDYPNIKRMWEIGDNMAKARRDDDRHDDDLARARLGVAAAHEQGRRRNDVREHQEGRPAEVDRSRSDAREGACRRS